MADEHIITTFRADLRLVHWFTPSYRVAAWFGLMPAIKTITFRRKRRVTVFHRTPSEVITILFIPWLTIPR